LFSKQWIYKNVFNLSKDDSDELLDQIVEDSKQMWRFKSIEEEGNDPAKPFQKINPNAEGTPPGGGLPELGGGGGLPDLGSPAGGELPGLGGGPAGGGPIGLPPLQEAKVKGDTNHAKWKQMVNDSEGTGSIEEVHGEHADDYERPSQEGEHDARKQHPFGEDPLGNLENKRKPRPSSTSLTPKWANDSPLSLETLQRSSMIKNLTSYLDKSRAEKKELIKEAKVTGSKSILDESNIIGE
jgi:hypothetical protein